MHESKYIKELAEGARSVETPTEERARKIISKWTHGSGLSACLDVLSIVTGAMGGAIIVVALLGLLIVPTTTGNEVLLLVYTGLALLAFSALLIYLTRKIDQKQMPEVASKLFYLLSETPYEARFRYDKDAKKIKITVEANLMRDGDCVIKTKTHHITAYIPLYASAESLSKFMMELVTKAEQEFGQKK